MAHKLVCRCPKAPFAHVHGGGRIFKYIDARQPAAVIPNAPIEEAIVAPEPPATVPEEHEAREHLE